MRKELGRRRARLLGAAALLGCMAVTKPGFAQAAGAASEADASGQAASLYEAGAKAFEANRLEEARVFFLAALRLKKHWQIAGNLGSIEVSLGRNRDGAEHLDFALRTAGDSISAQDRQRMQDLLDKARMAVGALSISVDAPGAEVFVDGKPVGKTPLAGPVFVEPGARVIEARREGYAVQEARREIGAGALAAGGIERTARDVERRYDEAEHSGAHFGDRGDRRGSWGGRGGDWLRDAPGCGTGRPVAGYQYRDVLVDSGRRGGRGDGHLRANGLERVRRRQGRQGGRCAGDGAGNQGESDVVNAIL